MLKRFENSPWSHNYESINIPIFYYFNKMEELNFFKMEEPGHPNFFLDRDGFMYRYTKKTEFKTYLLCLKKAKFGCKGTAVIENGLLLKNKGHTCLCKPREVSQFLIWLRNTENSWGNITN